MSEPTIASVLDKSIDKLSGGAAEIAKAAKQVAPHAWEAAVRQQVIEGWSDVATAVTLAVCCAMLFGYGRRYVGERKYYSSETKDFTDPSPSKLDKKGFSSLIAPCWQPARSFWLL